MTDFYIPIARDKSEIIKKKLKCNNKMSSLWIQN